MPQSICTRMDQEDVSRHDYPPPAEAAHRQEEWGPQYLILWLDDDGAGLDSVAPVLCGEER